MPILPPTPAPLPSVPAMPFSGAPVWVTVVTALSCLGLGLSVSLLFRGGQAVSAPLSPCASSSAPERPKLEGDKLTLAAQGESAAMVELNAIGIEQRSVAQAIALSKGRVVEKHLALDQLRENLAQNVDVEGIKKLMQFAQDGDTVRAAFGIAANLSGDKGCDLLYELMTAKATPPEMALIAGQFLNSGEVRAKASPALTLVLGLRDATTCAERKAILEKSVTVGDKRLVRHIVPLTKKTGCGEKKSEDCHPCLRDDNQKVIREALTRTQARKGPRPLTQVDA